SLSIFCQFVKLFFFQAEDGIRSRNVTGVQTCALPIFTQPFLVVERFAAFTRAMGGRDDPAEFNRDYLDRLATGAFLLPGAEALRSEERRVGKECRSRW